MQGKSEEYLASVERRDYVSTRAEKAGANFLALNITSEKVVNEMLDNLSSYGVTKEKYESFGYNYENVKKLAAVRRLLIAIVSNTSFRNLKKIMKTENSHLKRSIKRP